ncbi:MAG: ADOP family duplicated permease [Gemmatimonas sp.]|nr:ABC transporter permease [Gemmatimonadaceae bacterium]
MNDRGAWTRVFRIGVGARHIERDVDQELEFHIAMRAQKLAAAGLPPDAARARALERFGDMRTVRDSCLDIDHQRERAMRRTNYLSNLRQDIAYALRSMRQNAGFTAVVLLTLALGIGANTSTFTLIDALVLRELPVPHPEQLVTIGNPARVGGLSDGTPRNDIVSYPVFADVRAQSKLLTGIYASGRASRLDMLADEAQKEPEHPRGRFVSANYFSVLQVPAVLGRTFSPDEDLAPGGAPVIVISHAYWQTRFGGDRSVIGRSVRLNGVPLTIIGVTPRTFTGDIVGQRNDVWIPIMEQPALMPNSPELTDRSKSWLLMMGRLAPGVSLTQARSELTTVENRSLIETARPDEREAVQRSVREKPLQVASGARGFSYYRHLLAAPLFILMTAVGIVLLIVCANLANLMLARASSRGREMSVRMALGANRARLVQQLLTESLILALAGGALGVLLAIWGSSALISLTGGAQVDSRLDARVLAFTAVLSLATAVLFGLVPALSGTRVAVAAALRAQGRGVSNADRGTGRFGLGKMLVIAQVALSVLLLVGTGMLVRSMQRLQTADIGVARDRLLLVEVDAERAGYKDARLLTLMRALTARASQTPGVVSATLSENGIFSGTESGTNVRVEGFTAQAEADSNIAYDDVGPGYFQTIGAHLLQGRDFEARDDESGAKVAVLNETAARFFFPRGNAIGAHVSSDSSTYEIVGIVSDIEEQNLRAEPSRRLYIPAFQIPGTPGKFRLEVRTSGDPARLVEPVRRSLAAVDPSLSLQVESLSDLIQESIAQDRLVANVVSVFGILALALAALGLYGVMTYATTRRTSEFGLRMALGAEPVNVQRLVLGEAMLLVAGGVMAGIPAALGAMQLIKHQLYEIGLLDVPSFLVALAVLGGSAALAGYVPARRAARVGPLVALRDA